MAHRQQLRHRHDFCFQHPLVDPRSAETNGPPDARVSNLSRHVRSADRFFANPGVSGGLANVQPRIVTGSDMAVLVVVHRPCPSMLVLSRLIHGTDSAPFPIGALQCGIQMRCRHRHRSSSPSRSVSDVRNPIRDPSVLEGGLISSRIASNTTRNWLSYLASRASSFCARSLWTPTNSRSRTKARTTWMLAATAAVLFKTDASMTAPCSVNA
jgi:hypothetical protein